MSPNVIPAFHNMYTYYRESFIYNYYIMKYIVIGSSNYPRPPVIWGGLGLVVVIVIGIIIGLIIN